MKRPGRSAGSAATSSSRATTKRERALRFAIYHLIGAANPRDERVSIGARALTGDSYLGHVFWDTEIYPAAVLHPAPGRRPRGRC